MRALRMLLLVFLLSPFLFSENGSLHGIDVSDLNRKADPCSDFYEFADGTWRVNNPIPPSMARWSRRWQAGESSKDKLKEILEQASQDKGAAHGSANRLSPSPSDSAL